MDTWIKLNASTTGKDKLFRLVQYLSRLLWYRLESRKHLRDTVHRLRVLEASISTFRKLLRVGKSLEVIYGALRTLHLPDVVLRTSLTLSRIYQAFFLLADHIVWLGRAGLCEIDRDKWGRLSNRFWLGAIVCNLFRDAYEILQLLQKKMKHMDLLTTPTTTTTTCGYSTLPVVRTVYHNVPWCRPVVYLADTHRDILWDTVKNLCDLCIPLANLGHTGMSSGTVGLMGSVSSVAGIISVLDPLARMAPT
ncbi:hypothetical protein Pmani_037987 [Petrolisthes manimaculis]|uniref:Peroxisomal membrane protein 11B n=1 Tax=Petrolisthes manimaculis TaxID=1843537 RepID=A0AAE1TMS6_9EUCA|nr:hypothetical protein Pmani_037987 [Petrolisthes manimaculis]